MTTEQKQILKDSRMALIVLGVALMLGFWVGRASACDSFVSYMEEANTGLRCYGKSPDWKIGEPDGGCIEIDSKDSRLKAICYKLDEISKKIDK